MLKQSKLSPWLAIIVSFVLGMLITSFIPGTDPPAPTTSATVAPNLSENTGIFVADDVLVYRSR